MQREQFTSAAPFLPPTLTIESVRRAASGCQGCDLFLRATQTVFGEGASRAAVMLVGEQPGDKEDLAGHPFVGPAGRMLEEALAAAGILKSEVYITNVVKHFSWSPDARSKRRIHKKPRYSEIQACRPWLDAEIAIVQPRVIVCLGATAAQALLGRTFSVTRQRGEFLASNLAARVMATVHPSSILRAPDEPARREQKAMFIRDLTRVAGELRRLPKVA
ncbi:MAG: UdgX family uracil-DNA binding protein [Acidobacteria bacterium]|nr:UdgX family uracil-DNA binding protein [Acidobacteriota bacterium]